MGCDKQAAAAATMHPEQRLIPLDCACSFGSVIPLSAVRSEKAFTLPGAPVKTFVRFTRLRPSSICLGNSAPVWLAA